MSDIVSILWLASTCVWRTCRLRAEGCQLKYMRDTSVQVACAAYDLRERLWFEAKVMVDMNTVELINTHGNPLRMRKRVGKRCSAYRPSVLHGGRHRDHLRSCLSMGSRCSRLHIRPSASSEIRKLLQSRRGVTEDAAPGESMHRQGYLG